jgi:hypothetical protein
MLVMQQRIYVMINGDFALIFARSAMRSSTTAKSGAREVVRLSPYAVFSVIYVSFFP